LIIDVTFLAVTLLVSATMGLALAEVFCLVAVVGDVDVDFALESPSKASKNSLNNIYCSIKITYMIFISKNNLTKIEFEYIIAMSLINL
jgi:hypothetical protein